MGNLYTKMKIFHFRDKIESLPRDRENIFAPLHIRLKPTNICNQNCYYCSYRVKSQQLGQDMIKRDYISESKMIEILDDIIEMKVKAVTFSGGGEPFCYPYLLKAIKRLSKTTIKFSCITNGARLKGELAEIFAYNGTWLRVSIDGWDNESYASYRGVSRDEFAKIMNNMENFKKKNGKCYLGVVLVVDKKNATHIYGLVEKIKNIGVNSIKISPCIVDNRRGKNNEYHKTISKVARGQILRAIKNFSDEKFEIFDSYNTLDEKFKKEYKWCPYLQINPVIGADLNVYSCHDKAYNLKNGLIGSIKNQRLKDFWFSTKNKFFKINPSLECNHHCAVNEKNKLILDYLNADKEHLAFV